jgi:hypothetical protein
VNSDGALTLVTNPKGPANEARWLPWDLQRTAIGFEVVDPQRPLITVGQENRTRGLEGLRVRS